MVLTKGSHMTPAPPATDWSDAAPTRADALRRIVAEVSARQDLGHLFEEVIDAASSLFGTDRAGLWTYDGTATPLDMAAQRGLSPEMLDVVASIPREASTIGLNAIRDRRVLVLDGHMRGIVPRLARMYRAEGIRTICCVPIVFRDEPLGLLVLYHRTAYAWTSEELGLARAFGDHIAIAMQNARLAAASRSLAERLRSIADLSERLSSQQDVDGIARIIVDETRRLIDHDTLRVYSVDHVLGICEPVAFQGTFLGVDSPEPANLRVKVGQGLTGWVAAHGVPVRLGDAAADPRSIVMGDTGEPESMLVVPMSFEGLTHGVIVVSKVGRDRFDADDETTLSIFGRAAAQALVNAEHMHRLTLQQGELQHQLASQRRLLEVNERLLSTLEPASVLELIADSIKAIVPYDSLTIYQVDREAGVRRAVVARDQFADEILADESPIGVGISGWVVTNREAVLANRAHLDPRSVQVPGTPFEPEAMIVVPLLVGGETIGTLNIARTGDAEATFSANEFELTKLFAGQASIALQNALAHDEVQDRADHDSLTGLHNHGAFQRELGEAIAAEGQPFAVLMMDLDDFKGFNDTRGHPAGDALLSAIARTLHEGLRDGDRVYRYGGDEFAAILPHADRVAAHDVAERLRRAIAAVGASGDGPPVTITIGVACYPDDGTRKDALVSVADRAMYLAKPPPPTDLPAVAMDDPYVRALDETTLALLDRHDATTLLETILTRACSLLGTPHGFIYVAEPGAMELELRHGTGLFAPGIGHRQTINEGLGGEVYLSGRPIAIDDYDAYIRRADFIPQRLLGAAVGVPLRSGDEVVGVIGLASGSAERHFGDRDIDALTRFAKLASIGLDNARLVDVAQRGALYDPTTGLPNRELLTDRIAHALAGARTEGVGSIAVILLDLDRFKVINESVGHAIGDRLLVAVGQRLSETLRPSDTVARFGGDEFGIVLDSVENAAEARRIADRLTSELRAPFLLAGREWFISASMGIAIDDDKTTTPEELLREAEIAMVWAKAQPTARHALFEPSMSTQTLDRLDLENDLRRALERHELRVYYQPLVTLATGAIVGFEALVRWQHPQRGLVPPLSFIPLAEETGLIVPLGRWVLEESCRQVARWRATPAGRDMVVSVNLSARQFVHADLAEDVAAVLATTGIEPAALELEITESVVMDQSEVGIRGLRRLRDLGVRLVLDDFGTGYSSLAYLKHLPLDTIKIDRSFVAGLDGAADRSIVQAVLALADGLGIGVVAEGIETETQREQLLALGCELGQGYLFSPPVPADAATKLITPAQEAPRPARPKRPRVSSGRRRKDAA